MAGFSDIGVFLGYAEWAKVDYYTARPMETQERILKSILKKNKDTEYGKKVGLGEIDSIREFQEKIPFSNYDTY